MSLALVPNQSSPQHFVFAGKHLIRVIDRNGEPWFIAADACAPVGVSNVSDVLSRLDEDEKDLIDLADVVGRKVKLWAINEAGLYSMILTSRKPEAKAFKRWITHDVLPAIRKTGAYIAPVVASMTSLDLAEAILANLREQERRLSVVQEVQVEQDQRLSDIEVRQTAIERGAEYFTITGFARKHSIRVDNTKAQSLGKYASRYSRKHGYPIGEAPDVRHGTVGTYHTDVLRAVFGLPDQDA